MSPVNCVYSEPAPYSSGPIWSCGISSPFPRAFPTHQFKAGVLATWIIALAVYSPYLFVLAFVEYADEKQVCKMLWNETFGPSSSFANYSLALYVVFRHVPIVFLTILHSIILIKLKKQKIPGKQSVNAEQQRTRKNRNVIKMAIAIVVGFVLCWVPISIIN